MLALTNNKRPKTGLRKKKDNLTYAASTANKFQTLTSKEATATGQEAKKPKLPVPITVTDKDLNIDQILQPLNIQYEVKLVGIGKKDFYCQSRRSEEDR